MINTLARPKIEECNGDGSEGSYQSFQEGEHSESEARPEASASTSPAIPGQVARRQEDRATTAHQTKGGDQADQDAGGYNSTDPANKNYPKQLSRDVQKDDAGGLVGSEEREGSHSAKEEPNNRVRDALLTAGPALVQRTAADATTCRGRSFAGNDGANHDISDARTLEAQHKVVTPSTVPRPHEKQQDREQNQRVYCKRHGGAGQSQESTEGNVVLPNAIPLPPQAATAERRRVRFAADVREERHSGAGVGVGVCSALEEEEGEEGEDASLLPEASDSPKEHTEGSGGGHSDTSRRGRDASLRHQVLPEQGRQSVLGVAQSLLGCRTRARENEKAVILAAAAHQHQDHQHEKAHKDIAVGEKPDTTTKEEFAVDDVDDEGSKLLDPSPTAISKSTPARGDAAAGPSSSSSPSSSSTAATRSGAATATARTPPPARSTEEPIETSSTPAEAEPYNYYELPPIPEKAPGVETSTVQNSEGANDNATGKPQEPSSPTGEENVSAIEFCFGIQGQTRAHPGIVWLRNSSTDHVNLTRPSKIPVAIHIAFPTIEMVLGMLLLS